MLINQSATMPRLPTLVAASLCATLLAGCDVTSNDANVGATTGTDAVSDVAATGDATAGTTASPSGVPATGTTGGVPTVPPAP